MPGSQTSIDSGLPLRQPVALSPRRLRNSLSARGQVGACIWLAGAGSHGATGGRGLTAFRCTPVGSRFNCHTPFVSFGAWLWALSREWQPSWRDLSTLFAPWSGKSNRGAWREETRRAWPSSSPRASASARRARPPWPGAPHNAGVVRGRCPLPARMARRDLRLRCRPGQSRTRHRLSLRKSARRRSGVSLGADLVRAGSTHLTRSPAPAARRLPSVANGRPDHNGRAERRLPAGDPFRHQPR